MAYVPTAAESYGTDASVIQLDSSHPGYVSVPDAKFLFTAEFHRAGPDLLLTGQDGERHLIPGYFTAAERPALTAPNGASLSPDLIHLLAGSVAPGQYAQAQPSAPPDSIGKIEKVVGDVTVVRNGVSVALNVGDAVYKSDVIQTGANSSVGIGFPDGTALQLVANTRMALNDYSYDPNGTSNTALFSLVEGTFAFVAGKVAHTGDMKIATPVATMGIRGTTGYVQEAATISANSGNVSYSYVIVDDYGSTNHGQYDLIDQSGNVVATVSQTEYITYVTPQGIGLPPLVSTMPMSNSQVAFGQALIQQVFQTLNLINNPNPQTNGTNGSSTPEQLNSPLFPQLIHDQGTIPLDLNGSGGGSSPATPLTATLDIITPPPLAATNIFIWTSPASGTFQTAPDWNTGAVPAASDTVEINNPLVTVTVDQVETVNNLMVVAGAVVDVVNDSNGNGFLTILSGLDNAGLIEVGSQGSDPKLEDIGATTVASGAQIEANGSDATVDFQNNEVVNAGIIDATNHGTVSFEFVTIDNEPGGNAGEGTIIAQLGGTVTLDHTIINNTDSGLNDGSVVANGAGSTAFLYDGTTVVGGTLSTSDGGLIEIANGPDETSSNVTFDGSETSGLEVLPVTIASGSEVLVTGGTSLTLLGDIINEGTIDVDTGVSGADLVIEGTVTLSGSGVITLTGSTDEITGAANGGTLDNIDNSISGVGEIIGTTGDPLTLDNQTSGVIEANVPEGILSLDTGANAIINAGLIEANGGTLTIDATPVTNTGTLKATDDSTLTLSGDTVTNTGGTVEVDAGSTLDLESATISNGIVTVDGLLDSTGPSAIDGAAITIVSTGTLESTSGALTIDPGSIDNSGLLEANGGALTIDVTPMTNTGTLKATDDSTLTLSGDTVTNTDGTVQVDAGSTLDLESATISNGIVTLDGLLDSTGTSAIDGAAITMASTGTLESTSGTLTIDPGSIDNTGLLEANGGALTIDATPVTNSGTLKATDDSTLTLSGDTVTNTGGTVQVDAGSTLDLEGSSVNGGTVDVSGTLNSTGTSAIDGASLTDSAVVEATSGTLTIDPGSIDNTGLLEANGGALTIDDTPVTNTGTLKATDDSALALSGDTVTNTGGTVQVDAGSTFDLEGSSANGGTVDVSGTLNSTGTSAIDGASLTDSAVVEATSGTLTIDPGSIDNTGLLEANGGSLVIDDTPVTNTGTLKATDDSTLTLSGDTVTNTGGTVQVDAGSTLDLEGSSANGGTVDVSGTLNSTGTSAIDGASLTDSAVVEATSGTLTIDPGSIDNTGLLEANGGSLVIDDTPVTNTGTLKATDDSTLTLSGDTVTNTGGTVQVDAGSTLDLEGSSVNGGTVDVSGTLDSTGASSISDAPLIDTGLVEVTSGTLTIDPNWVINSGLLEANGGSLVIDDTPVTNTGTLKATDDSALALSGDTVTNTGGTVQVDVGSTLDLEGSSVNGGTVDVSGTLNSTGTSAIDGASLTDSGVVEATSGTLTIGPGSIDNSSLLEANGGSLVIDDTPVTNTGTLKATDDSTLALSGDTVTNTGGTMQVDAGSTLDLEGSSVNVGTVDVSGTLNSTGTSSINGANLTDTDLVEVTSDTLTLSGDTVTNTGGVVQVDAGSLLDFGSSSIAGGTVDVYGTLNSTGASSINGASLTTSGVVESTSGTLTIDPGSVDNSGLLEANGGALTIDDTPVTNTGTLKATDASALALSGDTVANTGGLVQMDAGSTSDLEGSGISGGTVDVSGALNSTGTSSISAATLIDAGLVEVTSGTLTIDDTPVINTGTLQAAGASTLIIGGAVDNSLGTVVVDYGSKVDIGGDIFDGNAVVDGGTLTYGSSSNVGTSFDGIGMLVLDGTNSSNQFTGTVSDFGNGDIIDLAAISYSDETGLTYNAHLDTLTVSDGISGPSMTIQLAGSYSASNFVLSNDGNGDAELTFTAGEAHELPTLWLDATTATVSQGSTVVLPTIRVIRVDSDDTLTLTIAGLPTGATITDSADSKVFSGSSFTLTGAEVGSTLTLHDGSNSGNFTLNVTANNTTIGEAASSATQTLAVTVNPSVGPAGVAGSPINLALANPSAANGAAVTVTITGVPSDWQLNQGTNLGNGTWTVQSDDLTTLTVLTAAAYAGAVELGVTETWTGANGATGLATIADNVETYAAGSPIFAWSGDDTLTGVGGHDEFVFAQSIGSDTIYNFNVATDKIDLLGFANVASFGDVEGHVTADSNGDAVITLGAGETITLHGVNVGSLTAADFVFNETPVVDNAGTLAVSDGATLPLDGTIDNTGTIALNGTGDQTELQIVGDGVTLQGGGQITMSDGAGDIIVGTTAATTLTNVDNTISGAGQIGAGDGNLTLVNEVHGTIEANIAGGILTVDTGNDITNNGILEATNGAVLQIDDAVSGSGHAVIAGGTVAFDAAANIDVIFDNGTSRPTYGELVLGDASAFAGQISGFSGTAPDAGHSDVIDLAGINYDSSSFSETYNASSGLLTVSDGSNIANLTLDNFDGTLSFASNGDGGTLITDPPATSSITADGVLSLPADGSAPTYTESVTPNGHDYVGSFSLDPVIDGNGSPSVAFQFALANDQINLAPGQVLTQSYNVDIAAQNPVDTLNQTVAVSIGGPGADNFVFAPGIGAETIANFDPQHDTIELNGFTDAHTVAELQSLITTDLHGDAVIDLGHNDSITLAGVTAGHLQAVLQSAVHLH